MPHSTNHDNTMAPPTRRGHLTISASRAGLFPCEAEIARRLSQTPADWRAKAIVLERDGLPPIDPIMGGRYWPAVQAYWNRRYGLSSIQPSTTDGEENFDALK